MIYLDTSVALAHLLAEDRLPPAKLWEETLVSSRLLQYEVWNRIHGRGLFDSHGEQVRLLLARLGFLEFSPPVLERALEPFPIRVRTLDALHLASMDFLRRMGQMVRLASYDLRQVEAALAMGFTLAEDD